MSQRKTPTTTYVSREDYLDAEQTSVEKHEWINGAVLELRGGNYRNSRTNANLIAGIGNAIGDGPCFILESNMRLWMKEAHRYTYPDAQIVCGEPEFDPADRRQTTITIRRWFSKCFPIRLNPTIAVQSSRNTSRCRPCKRTCWCRPASRASNGMSVRLAAAGFFNHAAGLKALFSLEHPKFTLPLAELYAGVTFDPPPDPNASRIDEPL